MGPVSQYPRCMDHRLTPVRRIRRLLLAAALGLSMLGAMPWAVAAADESPAPTPVVTPAPTPSPDPTAAPPETQATPPPATETSPPDPTSTPPPDPTPPPAPTPTPDATPRPTPVITSVNLYRAGAMVRQYTSYWCVPAATQSMLNLALHTSNRRFLTQKYFYARIREHNRYRYATRGNDPQGWAYALRYFTRWKTTYQARSFTNKTQAINAIVDSIARTHQPVGVPVWGGTHAWVVVGYRSQSDPSAPSRRTVLGLYVSGPLASPRDPWVYEYLSVATFRLNFTRYHEWQRRVIWEGRWVIISQ